MVRRFSRLSDGITKRKYAIGQVTMSDGKEISLIDVEREDKALSMLILKADGKVNWNWISNSLLIALVDESGKWSNKIIKNIEKMKIIICRKKHVNKRIREIEN